MEHLNELFERGKLINERIAIVKLANPSFSPLALNIEATKQLVKESIIK